MVSKGSILSSYWTAFGSPKLNTFGLDPAQDKSDSHRRTKKWLKRGNERKKGS